MPILHEDSCIHLFVQKEAPEEAKPVIGTIVRYAHHWSIDRNNGQL